MVRLFAVCQIGWWSVTAVVQAAIGLQPWAFVEEQPARA
jgi:hypothetical protein